MSGTSFIRGMVDGRAVLIPNDPDPGYKNPPLTALNAAYRQHEVERRGEVNDAVEKVQGALQSAFGPTGKRIQKNLRG